MHWLLLTLLLTGSSVAQNCSPVHLIVSRASGEAPGYGVSAKLSDAIKQALPGTTSEALVYPAKIPYTGSMAVGTANLKTAIAKYTASCPSSQLVLIGYSQGGAVTLDALCGGGGHAEIGPHTDGFTKEQGRNIKAVVVFGEPRYVPGMPYNVGTSKTAGLYARSKTDALCPIFAPIIKSWCDTNDSRCASGKNLQVHTTYLNRYQKPALDFILSSVKPK